MRNVVLIGFMGTGKSAVGVLLARRLGWRCIDTDQVVETRHRTSVSRIFHRRGEAYFRELEARVVAEVAALPEVVIATGGGVVLRPENMTHLRQHGWIVALTAPKDVLLSRLRNGPERPLLRSDPRANLSRLLAERERFYRDADLIVDVTTASPERVVDAIVAFLGNRERHSTIVRLEARSYPIYIGEGILPLLSADLAAMGAGRKVGVISHPTIPHAGAKLARSLRAAGYEVTALSVSPGERSKSLSVAAQLLDRLARDRHDRSSSLVAVGGGVIGDLTGFVAATYMRGIRLIQVPTTLLAMVDSSIGGKTGVNHAGVKNLVGAIYQPAEVLADVRVLATLPDRELRSGLAEVIKTAVIGDAQLFDYLDQHLEAILHRDPRPLIEVVSRCTAFKATIVETDERDVRERQILNYGHTAGHAIEAAAGLGRYTHGEAIAIGMALEASLAYRLGLVDAGTVERQNALIARAGLPTAPRRLDRRVFVHALRLDKKIHNGVLRCPLLRGVGKMLLEQEVPEALLREVMASAQSPHRLRSQSQSAR
jgi:3-dehydroquinate synthase